MKSAEDTLKARATKIAKQWGLTLQEPLRVTSGRAIYRVSSANGPAVLKVYAKIGSSGEGGAVPFLRHLPKGIGVQILRTSPLRRAVLMEWLDGSSLDQLILDGHEAKAETHFADVAVKLAGVAFRSSYLFPRAHDKKMQHRFRTAASGASAPRQAMFTQAADMLDQLIATTTRETVIHGDLQFRNVMLTPQGPRLFDPKGFRADPASEYRLAAVPRYQTNDVNDFMAKVERRTALFSDTSQMDQNRITRWAAVTYAGRIMNGSLRKADRAQIAPYLAALLDLARV